MSMSNYITLDIKLPADVRRTFFETKEQYLAFRRTWASLMTNRVAVSGKFHLVHALLTNGDTTKLFACHKRSQLHNTPYVGIHKAIRDLKNGVINNKYWETSVKNTLKELFGDTLSFEQYVRVVKYVDELNSVQTYAIL